MGKVRKPFEKLKVGDEIITHSRVKGEETAKITRIRKYEGVFAGYYAGTIDYEGGSITVGYEGVMVPRKKKAQV